MSEGQNLSHRAGQTVESHSWGPSQPQSSETPVSSGACEFPSSLDPVPLFSGQETWALGWVVLGAGKSFAVDAVVL